MATGQAEAKRPGRTVSVAAREAAGADGRRISSMLVLFIGTGVAANSWRNSSSPYHVYRAPRRRRPRQPVGPATRFGIERPPRAPGGQRTGSIAHAFARRSASDRPRLAHARDGRHRAVPSHQVSAVARADADRDAVIHA